MMPGQDASIDTERMTAVSRQSGLWTSSRPFGGLGRLWSIKPGVIHHNRTWPASGSSTGSGF